MALIHSNLNVRTLIYRFFGLSYILRIAVARNLGLLKDEDKELKGLALFTCIIYRAAERNILADLWDQVEEKYGDQKYSTNPFRQDNE